VAADCVSAPRGRIKAAYLAPHQRTTGETLWPTLLSYHDQSAGRRPAGLAGEQTRLSKQSGRLSAEKLASLATTLLASLWPLDLAALTGELEPSGAPEGRLSRSLKPPDGLRGKAIEFNHLLGRLFVVVLVRRVGR